MDQETTKLVYVGFIRKSHGNKGQILVSLLSNKICIKNNIDLVWLGTNPDHTNEWKLEKIVQRDINVFLKLRDINSIEEAEYLQGLKVYLPKKSLKTRPMKTYLGFKLISAKTREELGKIIKVDYSNIQPAFIVETPTGSKYHVPAVIELIDQILEDEEIIHYKNIKGLFNEC